MNGYPWFLAARVHAARAQEAHHRPEPRTSRGVTALGLVLLLAAMVTTHMALTG